MVTTLFVILLVFLAIGIITRGPLLALSISWFISAAPIALGLVSYNYFNITENFGTGVLIIYILLYVVGLALGHRLALSSSHRFLHQHSESPATSPLGPYSQAAKAVWVVSIVAMIAQVLDYARLGNASIDDLPGLRDVYQNKTSSAFTLIANVTSWACLYCFAYSKFHRNHLTRAIYIKFLSPTLGFFLVSVLSAGRQAAMQILLMALILDFARPKDTNKRSSISVESLVIMFGMIIYMAAVAIFRNDGAISESKTLVLMQIFDFELGPFLFYIASNYPTAITDTIVETIAYFSTSIALFSEFLLIPKLNEFGSFGAMTFPFIMRQLEVVTGISVLGALQEKMALMYSIGSMGAGWTTAFSGFILDFGYIGAAICTCGLGAFAQYSWSIAKLRVDFHRSVVATLMIMSTVYLPLVFLFSETNMLLLLLFCAAMQAKLRPYSTPVRSYQ